MPFLVFVLGSSAIAASTVGATLLLARWRVAAAVAAAVGGATALMLFHGLHFDFYHDDAFITLRYSRHLADGLGPNWNSEGRVEGYTSFLWMALHAGLAKLGLDLVDASRLLALAAILSTFFAVYRIWKLWGSEEPDSGIGSPIVLAVVLLGVALTDSVAFWGFSGMETPLFMALLTGGAYLFLLERRGERVPWSAVVFSAAAMTRPEGLILVAVTGAFKASDVLLSKDAVPALRRYLAWAAVFLLLYGSYFVWRYTYYDYLLPNTFYAKVEPSLTLFNRGLGYVTAAGQNYHLLPAFTGTAILLTTARLSRDAAYIIALCGFLLLGIVFEGGDDFGAGRFVVPVLPLLFLSGLAGFAVLLKRSTLGPTQVAMVASIALILAGLWLLPLSNRPGLSGIREEQQERELFGTWLNEHTPEDFTIAAFAVGAISYRASDREFLDLLGLNDVTIAHTDVGTLGRGILGHEKYNLDYVYDEVRPEIIVFADGERVRLTEQALRERFSRTSPVAAFDAMMTDPRLWRLYQVRSLNLEGKWYNFLQRTDTVADLQAPGLQ